MNRDGGVDGITAVLFIITFIVIGYVFKDKLYVKETPIIGIDVHDVKKGAKE